MHAQCQGRSTRAFARMLKHSMNCPNAYASQTLLCIIWLADPRYVEKMLHLTNRRFSLVGHASCVYVERQFARQIELHTVTRSISILSGWNCVLKTCSGSIHPFEDAVRTQMISTVIRSRSSESVHCQILTGSVDFACEDKMMKIQNIASNFITRKTATQVPDSV